MNRREQARLIMETIGVLHQEGYGLLKLYCYVKEGMGRWTYIVFAGDRLPPSSYHVPPEHIFGSLMSYDLCDCVESVDDVLTIFRGYSNVLELAKGSDPVYVAWYADMLVKTAPVGVLEMEGPHAAFIRGNPIATPLYDLR